LKEYHKIHTIFKRDQETKTKKIILGDWSDPVFEYLANNKWDWDEKIDGTNTRVMIDNQQCIEGGFYPPALKFGGKTNNAQLPAKLVEHLNNTFLSQKEKLFEMFPDGACLYGEGYGAGIQKGGGNYSQSQLFILFDVRVGNWWLEREKVKDISYKLGINTVPIIGQGTLHELLEFVSQGFRSLWGDFDAEGIVARPSIGLLNRASRRIITKLKHKDFEPEKT